MRMRHKIEKVTGAAKGGGAEASTGATEVR